MNMIKKISKLRKSIEGQSLIEVLLIVILITAVISGSIGFLVQAYSITQLASSQITATYLSIEGIEITKNILDANYQKNPTGAWNAGFNNPGSYEIDYESLDIGNRLNSNLEQKLLKFDPISNHYGYFSNPEDISIQAEPTPQQFKRRVEIIPVDNCEIMVSSVVEWVGRRCPANGCGVKLDDYFYDWRSSNPKCN